MGAKEDFRWIGSIRCLWGIMGLWLPAMLVGFAVGLVFGKALWGSPTLIELGGDRPAWLEEEVGKLIEGLPAPIDDASRLTILGSASAHHQVTQTYPWPARLLAWLLVALLMPLLASSLAQHGMDRRSNAINLGLVLGLSGFSGVAGFGLLGFSSRLGAGGHSADGGNRRLAALQLVHALETRRPLKRGVTVRREWPATRKVGVRWVSSAIVVPNAAAA